MPESHAFEPESLAIEPPVLDSFTMDEEFPSYCHDSLIYFKQTSLGGPPALNRSGSATPDMIVVKKCDLTTEHEAMTPTKGLSNESVCAEKKKNALRPAWRTYSDSQRYAGRRRSLCCLLSVCCLVCGAVCAKCAQRCRLFKDAGSADKLVLRVGGESGDSA